VAEAAEILGVAEGTIKSRCARGRARMALALGHLRTGDDAPAATPAVGERQAGGRPGAGRPSGDRPSGERAGGERAGGGSGGDGGHGGNRGGSGHVPSGSGDSVPLPAAGPIGASGDRGDQA
jgi:RNA polymerase sigma-70 factor, ECF subfamily